MGVYEKLLQVQKNLKAPKDQYNSFGKYKYRSCEGILEGLKPVLDEFKATVVISDSLELIGERYYVKATAQFIDTESGEKIENSAYSRESFDKKGMDESQITGASSSYARKYALNGLFLIDDTKDADTDEYKEQQNDSTKKTAKTKETAKPNETQKSGEELNENLIPETNKKVTPEQLAMIKKEMERTGITERTLLAFSKTDTLDQITQVTAVAIINKLHNTGSKK